MNKPNLKTLLIFLLILIQSTAFANNSLLYGDKDGFPKIENLNWLNEQSLENQRKLADEISRKYLGKRIKQSSRNENTRDNLTILQRLISETEVANESVESLQALGVVMGDIYVSQVKQLEWKTFEDEVGKSKAVCVKNTKHCIFPITMLSRRMAVDIKPDVNRIYKKGYDAISDYLPKLPFSD